MEFVKPTGLKAIFENCQMVNLKAQSFFHHLRHLRTAKVLILFNNHEGAERTRLSAGNSWQHN